MIFRLNFMNISLPLALIGILLPASIASADSPSSSISNVIVAPASIAFGAVQAKADNGASLVIVIPGGLASNETVNVQSSNPSIIVQPSLPDKTSANTVRTGALHYRVTLSPKAHPGIFTAQLSVIETIVTRDGAKTVTPAAVPVTGDVMGALAAEPPALDIHEVRRGRVYQWQIAVKAGNAQDLRSLQVKSASPYLTVIGPPQPSIQLIRTPDVRVPIPVKSTQSQKDVDKQGPIEPVYLTITLSPDAPVGSFTGSVVVSTSSGEKLTIPVAGAVIP